MSKDTQRQNIPRNGKILNLSVLATQFFLMVVITSVVVSYFVYALSFYDISQYGADVFFDKRNIKPEVIIEKFKQQGLSTLVGFFEDIGFDPKWAIAFIALKTQKEQAIQPFIVTLSVITTLIVLIAARFQLIDKNQATEANPGSEEQKQQLEKKLMQCLDIKPIVIGQHTAFQRRSLLHPFKKPALVLAKSEVLACSTGKLTQIKYIINHELCHKLSWDLSLGYMIKLTSIVNCLILAFLYSIKFFLVITTIPFIPTWLFPLLTLGIGILLYGLLMKNYYYFSMFKEHIADQFAALKSQCLQSAVTAIDSLSNEASKLHPDKQSRITFLTTEKSSYPFKLFLLLNLMWWFGFIWFDRSHINIFINNSWAELTFIAINTPLLWFTFHHRESGKNRKLAIIFGAIIFAIILVASILEYHAYTTFNIPNTPDNFIAQLADNIGWYQIWLMTSLVIAQWPQK